MSCENPLQLSLERRCFDPNVGVVAGLDPKVGRKLSLERRCFDPTVGLTGLDPKVGVVDDLEPCLFPDDVVSRLVTTPILEKTPARRALQLEEKQTRRDPRGIHAFLCTGTSDSGALPDPQCSSNKVSHLDPVT